MSDKIDDNNSPLSLLTVLKPGGSSLPLTQIVKKM